MIATTDGRPSMRALGIGLGFALVALACGQDPTQSSTTNTTDDSDPSESSETTDPSSPSDPTTTTIEFAEPVLVKSVVDGDTIEILRNGVEFRIRFKGVNTPSSTQMVDLRPLRKRREILCGIKSVLKKSGWSSTPTVGLNLSTIVMTDTADFSPTFVWATVTTSQRSFSPRVSLGSTVTKTRFMTEWMHIMQRKAEHRTVTSAFGPTEQPEMATMVD